MRVGVRWGSDPAGANRSPSSEGSGRLPPCRTSPRGPRHDLVLSGGRGSGRPGETYPSGLGPSQCVLNQRKHKQGFDFKKGQGSCANAARRTATTHVPPGEKEEEKEKKEREVRKTNTLVVNQTQKRQVPVAPLHVLSLLHLVGVSLCRAVTRLCPALGKTNKCPD